MLLALTPFVQASRSMSAEVLATFLLQSSPQGQAGAAARWGWNPTARLALWALGPCCSTCDYGSTGGDDT